jgi:AraC family transcriptional regulator
MQPEIRILPEKQLIGLHLSMSLSDNKTGRLWQGFMPRRKEILNAAGPDLFSLQLYGPAFDPASPDIHASFEKWAAVEVTDLDRIPEDMELLTLPEGLYAVFHYKGSSAEGPRLFAYIYGTWLPGSGYELDDRPHFEILGPKYKNNDPESEEEIWIPIRPKNKDKW